MAISSASPYDDIRATTLTSREVVSTPFIKVFEGEILQSVWRVEEPREWALSILFVKSTRQVLCVRQFRLGASIVAVEFPAGRIDHSEEPQEAAMRELSEETGVYLSANPVLAPSVYSLGRLYTEPNRTNNAGHGFLVVCDTLDSFEVREQRLERTEFVQVEWIDLARLEEALRGETEVILHACHIAFLGRALARHSEEFDG